MPASSAACRTVEPGRDLDLDAVDGDFGHSVGSRMVALHRHGRAWRDHPRLTVLGQRQAWMIGRRRA